MFFKCLQGLGRAVLFTLIGIFISMACNSKHVPVIKELLEFTHTSNLLWAVGVYLRAVQQKAYTYYEDVGKGSQKHVFVCCIDLVY